MRKILLIILLLACYFCVPILVHAASSTTTTALPESTLNLEMKTENVEVGADNLPIILDCGKAGIFNFTFSTSEKTFTKTFESNINVSCKLKPDSENDTLNKYEYSFGDDQGSDNNYISGTPAKEFNGKKMWLKITGLNTKSSSSSQSSMTSVSSSSESDSSSSESSESSTTSTVKSTSKSSSSKTSTTTSTKTTTSKSSSPQSSKSSSSKSSSSSKKSSSSSKSSTTKTSTKSTNVKGASTLAKTGNDVNYIFISLLIIFTGALCFMSIWSYKNSLKKCLPGNL